MDMYGVQLYYGTAMLMCGLSLREARVTLLYCKHDDVITRQSVVSRHSGGSFADLLNNATRN
jgi:hypothetical protein